VDHLFLSTVGEFMASVHSHERGTTSSESSPCRACSVHPHGRGDHCSLNVSITTPFGSPPRAWGPQLERRLPALRSRFTPTGVGTTRRRVSIVAPRPVHPHGRGDHVADTLVHAVLSGSPPRAWGPRATLRSTATRPRFTPTGVGTTTPIRGGGCGTAVHPHGRGDHKATFEPPALATGSPPRAWGPRSYPLFRRPHHRFTPTGVGTTYTSTQKGVSLTVHPHGRGDHGEYENVNGFAYGSPPRAWGPRREAARTPSGSRFTPTGVGTTSFTGHYPFSPAVHPHGRGDHFPLSRERGSFTGSPPRAWGPPHQVQQVPPAGRFTPTGVGTTAKSAAMAFTTPVHPHGRGDHLEPPHAGRLRRGSPPRAWGPPRFSSPPVPPVRFTPTGVGTTPLL